MNLSIENIIKRIAIPGLEEARVREIISKEIYTHLNIEVKTKSIRIKDKILFISASPALKSAIILKKTKIQESLYKEHAIKINQII
jgi:hypothetical protein